MVTNGEKRELVRGLDHDAAMLEVFERYMLDRYDEKMAGLLHQITERLNEAASFIEGRVEVEEWAAS